MTSLRQPSRIDLWLDLLKGLATIPETERLLGMRGKVWSIPGIDTGTQREVRDGPAWAPTRSIKSVMIRDYDAFDDWVRRNIDEDFIDEYDAALVLFRLERDQQSENTLEAFAVKR